MRTQGRLCDNAGQSQASFFHQLFTPFLLRFRLNGVVKLSMKTIILFILFSLSALVVRADNLYVSEVGASRIGEYSTSGATINANLIPGLPSPEDIKVDAAGNLLVTCAGEGSVEPSSIGLYTTSGVAINRALTTLTANSGDGFDFYQAADLVGTTLATIVQNSASAPSFVLSGTNLVSTNNSFLSTYSKYSESIVSDGSYFYVNDQLFGHIQKFNLSGGSVNSDLVTMPTTNTGTMLSIMTIDGTNLYVSFYNFGYIAKYSTSGRVISTNLISGLQGPAGVAADGQGHLFVANRSSGTVGEYTTDGAVINASLITNLNQPWAIAVEIAPTLAITRSNNSVRVTWSAPTNYFLQTNANLLTANWTTDTNVTFTNNTNTATVSPPTGNLYFRLKSTNGE